MDQPLSTYITLVLAAAAAGAVNSLAGGGTLLTFPALTALGVPGVIANGTSTVALMPGSFASVLGFRRELIAVRRWALLLAIPSALGGVLGVELLTQLDKRIFDQLVPWLILTATLLFIGQPFVARITRTAHRPWPLWLALVVQFFIAVYGGYFGAGMGIVMLAVYSFMGLSNIHAMNAAKAVQAGVINFVAAAELVRTGNVIWHYAIPMTVAAIIGGYLGAHYGRRIKVSVVRWIVITIGVVLTAYYFTR